MLAIIITLLLLVFGSLILSFMSVFHMNQVATQELNQEQSNLTLAKLDIDGDATFNSIDVLRNSNFDNIKHVTLSVPGIITWTDDVITSNGQIQATNAIFDKLDMPGEIGASNFAASFNKTAHVSNFPGFINFKTESVQFPDALNNENWVLSSNDLLFDVVGIGTPAADVTTDPLNSTGILYMGGEVRIVNPSISVFGWLNIKSNNSTIILQIMVNDDDVYSQQYDLGSEFMTLTITKILTLTPNDVVRLSCFSSSVAPYSVSSFGLTCHNN